MKKMTNGAVSQFVPDAFVPGYRNRGFYIEGEDQSAVIPPANDQSAVIPPANDQATVDGQPGGDSPVTDEVQEDITEEPSEQVEEGHFICPICKKEYKTQANLENHMASKHPEV